MPFLTAEMIDGMTDAEAGRVAGLVVALDFWKYNVVPPDPAALTPAQQRDLLKVVCGPLSALLAASIQANRTDDWAAWVRADVITHHTRFNYQRYNTAGGPSLSAGIGIERVYVCGGCGRPAPVNALTADHVLPKSLGGPLFTWLLAQDNVPAAAWALMQSIDNRRSLNSRVNADVTYTPPAPPVVPAVTVNVTLGAVIDSRDRYYAGIADDHRNFVPLCRSCNRLKGARDDALRPALNLGGWTPATP